MTRKEAVSILSILRTAYPNAYKGTNANDVVDLWQSMFREDAAEVAMAVRHYIATDTTGYPPCIGQIKAAIKAETEPTYGGDYPAGSQGHVPLGQMEREAVRRLMQEPICLDRPCDRKALEADHEE